MLIIESSVQAAGIVFIMSDLALLVASAKTSLLDIAHQSHSLGNGLQNAAPGDKTGAPNNSVLYLFSVAEELGKIAKKCDDLIPKTQQ